MQILCAEVIIKGDDMAVGGDPWLYDQSNYTASLLEAGRVANRENDILAAFEVHAG